MNLALAQRVMKYVADTDGDLPFDPDDLSYRWYEAWVYFKRRPRLRHLRDHAQARLQAVPHEPPTLASVRPFMDELVEVFKMLNAWYEERER
jgi:hypothetical protein